MAGYNIGQKFNAQSKFKNATNSLLAFRDHEIEIVKLIENEGDIRNWLYEAKTDNGQVFQCRSSWLNDYWQPTANVVGL